MAARAVPRLQLRTVRTRARHLARASSLRAPGSPVFDCLLMKKKPAFFFFASAFWAASKLAIFFFLLVRVFVNLVRSGSGWGIQTIKTAGLCSLALRSAAGPRRHARVCVTHFIFEARREERCRGYMGNADSDAWAAAASPSAMAPPPLRLVFGTYSLRLCARRAFRCAIPIPSSVYPF